MEGINLTGTFTDPINAIEFLTEHPETELIFLDIRMPRMNGFDFVKELHNFGLTPCIVFVTGYDEYAIEAIRAAAFDFLMKPIVKDELEQCVERYHVSKCREKVLEKYQTLIRKTDTSQKVIFTHHRGFVAFHTDEIFFIRADGNYSFLNLLGGIEQIVTMQIGQIEIMLTNKHFFRINRSELINLKFIQSADIKEKCCYLSHNGINRKFETNHKKIKELQKKLIGF